MPLLCIHGSMSSGRLWRGLVKSLPGVEVHTPDLPGALGGPPAPPDVSGDLAVVEQALLALDGEVTVVGHSYGGLLALQLARLHPDRVVKVVAHEPVCWSFLDLSEQGPDGFFTPEELHGFLDPSTGGSAAWVQRFVDFWNGPGAFASFDARTQQAMCAAGPKTFAEVSALFAEPTPMEAWAAMRVPVRTTVGKHSPPAQKEVMRQMSAIFQDFEALPVPGGHLAPTTHAAAMLEVWRPWLES